MLTLQNCTLANSSHGDGLYTAGTLYYRNTLIASNSGLDCINDGGSIAANIHNLVEDGSCSATLSGDPRLAPLDAAGIHARLPDSPAIDAGAPAYCPAIDQRGAPRATYAATSARLSYSTRIAIP